MPSPRQCDGSGVLSDDFDGPDCPGCSRCRPCETCGGHGVRFHGGKNILLCLTCRGTGTDTAPAGEEHRLGADACAERKADRAPSPGLDAAVAAGSAYLLCPSCGDWVWLTADLIDNIDHETSKGGGHDVERPANERAGLQVTSPLADEAGGDQAGDAAGDASRIHCDRDGPVPAAPPDPASVSPEAGAEVEWRAYEDGDWIGMDEATARMWARVSGIRLQSRVCGPWQDVERRWRG